MAYGRGDKIEVKIDREGLGQDEWVGHLPDDTMVVIVGAGGRVGESVRAQVMGVERTLVGSSLLAYAEM